MFVVVHTVNPLNCPMRSFRDPTVWSKDSGPVTPCVNATEMISVDSMAPKNKKKQTVEKACLQNMDKKYMDKKYIVNI
jgi:hypothetical protein